MIVKPFRAVRYNMSLKDVVSPPYDAIGSELKKRLESKNPYNIVRLILPEGKDKYQHASRLFHKWIDEGILFQDKNRSIYPYQSFYRINGAMHSMQGILAIFKLSDFKSGVIMPHEKTFSAPKKDRLNLMLACSANFSPVLGLYKSSKNAAIDFDLITNHSVLLDKFTTDDEVKHRFYSLSEPDLVERTLDILKDYPVIIGDGHHRYETALNYKKLMDKGRGGSGSDWILMFLVDMAGRNISLLPINRMISGISFEEIKPVMAEFFEFAEAGHFYNNREGILITDGKESFTATASDKAMRFLDGLGISDLEKKIPTVVVDRLITGFLLKNRDIKIRYYGDDKTVKIDDNSVFIKLHPVEYDTIEKIVCHNHTMPQKSTFFYPKIPTGLVINRLDQDV